jgi:excisionase family DNA binding protein
MNEATREALLTVGAAARLLGISADRVRDLVEQGQIPCTRGSGGLRLLRCDDVERLRAERERRRAARIRPRGSSPSEQP